MKTGLVLVAAGLLLAGCGSNGPNATDAWVDCKRQVSAKLANPDSADFETTSVEMGDAPGGWYAVGFLTGELDPGYNQRLAFECHADENFTLDEARVRPAQ